VIRCIDEPRLLTGFNADARTGLRTGLVGVGADVHAGPSVVALGMAAGT
jgi:hypothetical protein